MVTRVRNSLARTVAGVVLVAGFAACSSVGDVVIRNSTGGAGSGGGAVGGTALGGSAGDSQQLKDPVGGAPAGGEIANPVVGAGAGGGDTGGDTGDGEGGAGNGGAPSTYCKPNEVACDGNRVITCRPDGSGYGSPVPCSIAQPLCSAGVCTTPPSCTGLAPNCGSGENCCASPVVPGGAFNRSNDSSSGATLSSYRLDKYEVTVGRFRKFVDAVVAGWRPAAGSGKHAHLNAGQGLVDSSATGHEPGWNAAWNDQLFASKTTWDGAGGLACENLYQTWTSTSGTHEVMPINCINWFQASAFCIWDGGFLPSEAEWNYAAAGGSEQRLYPWGATAPGANASLAIYGSYYNGNGVPNVTNNIAPVGSVVAGNGRYGQADLAGNVWEWNLDEYASYAACSDCTYVGTGATRGYRGGGSVDNAQGITSSVRSKIDPPHPSFNVGVRCAREP